MEIIVYIGSFDPFHYGHQEVINIVKAKVKTEAETELKIIIMPNNPRKGKPDRTSILIRVFTLSKLYPIFLGYQQWKDQPHSVLVDNLPVQDALDELDGSYSAIIGSDIVALNKKPKYTPKKWYIVERQNYPIDLKMKYFYDVPVEIINLEETKFQSLSSTMIRTSQLDPFKVMPKKLAEFYDPARKLGLTSNSLTYFDSEKNTYIKTFQSPKEAEGYLSSYHKIYVKIKEASLDHNLKLPIHRQILSDPRKVEIEPVQPATTLFDLIVKGNLAPAKSFILYLNKLHQYHQTTPWRHGDLSVLNILIPDDRIFNFYIIDYEKFQDGLKPSEMINDYYLFLGSILFYGQLKGYKVEEAVQELERYGTKNYTFQNKYPELTLEIRKSWMERKLYYEIS